MLDNQSFLMKNLARGNRNLLILSLFCFLGGSAGVAYLIPHVRHVVSGKQTVSYQSLSQNWIAQQVSTPWGLQQNLRFSVQIPASSVEKAWIIEYKDSSSKPQHQCAVLFPLLQADGTVDSSVLIAVPDHKLATQLKQLQESHQSVTAHGEWATIRSRFENAYKQKTDVPAKLFQLSPMIELPWIFVTCTLFAALGLLGIFFFVRRSRDPLRHPGIRAIARQSDPIQQVAQFDTEMASPRYTSRSFWITEHWLVQRNWSGLEIIRLQDIIWAFGTGKPGNNPRKYKRIYIYTSDTAYHSVWVRQDEEQPILGQLAVLAPRALQGYTKELSKAWIRNRKKFTEAVLAGRPPV